MSENISLMRQRHNREIGTLQDACAHETFTNMPFEWAPGHRGAPVDVCDWCGKILSQNQPIKSQATS